MTRAGLAVLMLWLGLPGCRDADGDLPRAYRELTVPEERLASPDTCARGRRLFEAHCVLCHGARGDGRGVRREGLSRPARDLTDAAWQRQTSPRHVYFTIREGVRGTPMPSWKALDVDDTWDLVSYVRSLGQAGQASTGHSWAGRPDAACAR